MLLLTSVYKISRKLSRKFIFIGLLTTLGFLINFRSSDPIKSIHQPISKEHAFKNFSCGFLGIQNTPIR